MIELTTNAQKANAVTHGGIFHADDVFATVLISKMYGPFTNVIRTFKVPEEINPDAIIYDIGGGKFDHHQKGGNGCRENGVPYSSVGLLWRKYANEILLGYSHRDYLFEAVDKELFQGIDAVDNGVLPKLDYPASVMSISRIISLMNPEWNSGINPDKAFIEAVELAEKIFDSVLDSASARAITQDIIDAEIKKAEGNIMVLDMFIPFQEAIFASKNEKAAEILYVVFPSLRGGYNVQAVPDSVGGFGQRKPLPLSWRGLNTESLQEITGVSTATFCHPAGFIAATDTLEDAVRLAKLAVET